VPWGIFERKGQDSGEWSGFLEKGTKLEGKLESSGTIRVDSEISGNILCHAGLILGEHARGKGQLEGNSVTIAGHFDGLVRAKSRVEIQTKAVVTGDVETPCLIIEPGAIFDGRCLMVAAKEPGKPITIPIRSAASRT
jgi:cytoskeletal protein CcmA (bactofilin family)